MELSKTKKISIWIAWTLFFPAGLWLTFKFYSPKISGNEMDILLFLCLICILAVMPIVINNFPILAMQGVSLSVFLIFGLAVEMLLTQIACMLMLVTLPLRKYEIHRLPLNSLIFFLVSLLTGLIYYSLGGNHDFHSNFNFSAIWIILIYQVTYFVVNQVAIFLVNVLLYRGIEDLIDKRSSIWDGVTTLVLMPVGIVLFILYEQMGSMSILLIGIPLISLAFILKLYYSSKEINFHLKKASEFGHQLTQKLQFTEVLDLFSERVFQIIPSDYAYVFDVFNKEKDMHLLVYMENGKGVPKDENPIKLDSGIGGAVWKSGKAMNFRSKKEWKHLDTGLFPDHVESVLAVPIGRDSQVVGIFFMASSKKYAFPQYQMMIMDILCSSLGVALENARNYERARQENERCGLTHLYNYRYFDSMLQKEFSRLQNKQLKNLSIVLIDIDRFKSINDTYGHQSGNEILIQLADRLEKIVGKTGVLARFGGEEFVILIPNIGRLEAFQFAEFIRLSIANKPFHVFSDLDEYRGKLLVSMTASIGVATAPIDAEDAQALIRHADRAMYTGAKQAGRNKVAQYGG